MPEFRPFALSATYAQTLAEFCVPWQPAAAPAPKPVRLNRELAEELGADPDLLAGPEGLAMFAGNLLPAGAKPVAQAYAGHQFGGFSPRLGDGRALLLGEVVDRQGRQRDIAFKGSGRTPFSRNGDGKCALGPALREFLVGEAMHALGIPTTRALAVVATGDMVRRERALPGAVLTRVAASHLRVGTFEYVAVHHGPAAVKQLADYAIARHDPDLVGRTDRYLALLDAVAGRQAELVARWLGVGFIHGVMNTDNMTISGETIDYGPCAFLESYHPRTAFSSIDSQGRYAYGRQASIAQWNLARLAETLLPLIDTDMDRAIAAATAVIEAFPERHAACWLTVMRAKLGIDDSGDTEADRTLADDFLTLLQRGRHDFTNSFRALHDFADGRPQALARLFANDPDAAAWQQRWQARQPQRDAALLATMKHANPWLIARNHQVENALEAAVDRNDLAPFDALLVALRTPFDERDTDRHYTEPAAPEIAASYQTFCGT